MGGRSTASISDFQMSGARPESPFEDISVDQPTKAVIDCFSRALKDAGSISAMNQGDRILRSSSMRNPSTSIGGVEAHRSRPASSYRAKGPRPQQSTGQSRWNRVAATHDTTDFQVESSVTNTTLVHGSIQRQEVLRFRNIPLVKVENGTFNWKPIPDSVINRIRTQMRGWTAVNPDWKDPRKLVCAASFANRKGSKWYKNAVGTLACKSCTANRAVCVKIFEGEIGILPLKDMYSEKEDGSAARIDEERFWVVIDE